MFSFVFREPRFRLPSLDLAFQNIKEGTARGDTTRNTFEGPDQQVRVVYQRQRRHDRPLPRSAGESALTLPRTLQLVRERDRASRNVPR